MEETSAINRQLAAVTLTPPSPSLSSGDSLHAPPLPSLPLDIGVEILCRLPVKILLQLRCVSKSWNSLISDPKFAKKHLRLSTTRHLHTLIFSNLSRKYILESWPLDSFFIPTPPKVPELFELEYPRNSLKHCFVGSCDGILCLASKDRGFVLFCNPSIRKLNESPHFEYPRVDRPIMTSYGFGYDTLTDNYKAIAVSYYKNLGSSVYKSEVKIHSLGTNFWRTIQEFPFVPVSGSGNFVSGRINWFACENSLDSKSQCAIISLDLGNESYQEILQPDYGGQVDVRLSSLGVLRDCLCMLSRLRTSSDHDVWVMKEYGNKESWTKLFSVLCPYYLEESYTFSKAIYISEDDQLMIGVLDRRGGNSHLSVYESSDGTYRGLPHMPDKPGVSVESLISPCS